MYLGTPNATDTEQLLQRYFQLQDAKTRRAIILESPTLRTGPRGLLQLAKMFATTTFLPKRPREAQQANEFNGELPSQQTLGFRRRELHIHAHNVHSSSVFQKHFGTASCLPTRRNPPRSSQKVTELPQKLKMLSKASHPAQCLVKNPERGQLLAKHQPPSSDHGGFQL